MLHTHLNARRAGNTSDRELVCCNIKPTRMVGIGADLANDDLRKKAIEMNIIALAGL
jgi:hypothetical protein